MTIEEKWMEEARQVARRGVVKSDGCRASFFGLPMLHDSLAQLNGLDSEGRAAVSDLVIEWANGSTVPKRFMETLSAIFRAYHDERKAIQGDSYRPHFPCGWSSQYADTLQKDRK